MSAARLHQRIHAGGSGLQLAVLAFAAGLLVLLWGGLAVHLSYQHESTLKQREAENDNLAQLFEEHVRRTLAAASITLKQLETEYRQYGGRLDLAQYLHDRQEELAPYSVLSVVDEHGDLIASSVPFAKPQNFRNLENFQFHMRDASQVVFIAKPRPGTVTGRPTVFLTRRMNKADGAFGGNTGVGMDPQYFSRFYEQIDLGADSVVTLIGRDGVIRARQSNTPISGEQIGRDVRNATMLSVHLKQSEHGKFRTPSPLDGVMRLNSYRSVKAYPLVVLIGVSEADALAQFEQRKNIYLWTAGGASVLIVAFAAVLLLQIARENLATKKLRASEERYALVTRATSAGIWDRNLLSGEDYLSPQGKQMLGYRGGDPCVGWAAFCARIHPDDESRVREAVAQSSRDGKPYRIEFRYRHKDGGYRWLLSHGDVLRDAQGEPARMIGSIIDITERKNSERHIQEQARLLDLIFRHSLDGIVVLDRDYNYVRVSESYAKACRRAVSAFQGHNHFDLYPSEFQQELEPFRKEKQIYSRSARPFIFPDHPEWGTTYWDLGVVPILDSHGEIELFLFTLKDVTGRVRAEEEVKVYIDRIRALSGRIVAVQEEERRALARELHDEIGQELTAVKIQLQAVALTGEGNEGTSYTDNLQVAVCTVAKLLEQVRSLSINLHPMQLHDLGLAVALSTLVARTASAAGWIAHVDENISSKRFDSSLELACYRVAQEALTNVMRHAGAGEVWITLQQSDAALRLTLRDNGSGFEIASARSASGMPHLGILGMEERVINVGGKFEIVTRRGEGTEVRATFPLATAVAAPSGVV